MTTQINHLRSGKKIQILNPNVDYSNLPKASNHSGHAGSNTNEVLAIWEKIKTENPEYMDIEVMGLELRLTANWSDSRKSCSYSCELTPAQLSKFHIVASKKGYAHITIHDSTTIEVTNGKNSFIHLCPSLITINTNNSITIEEITHRDWYVRESIASNPNTPVHTLNELAKDSDYIVRSSVANNPNTSVEVLSELAKDSNCEVRKSVAFNPNTPADIFKELEKTFGATKIIQKTNNTEKIK